MPKKRKANRYVFYLTGVNIEKVDHKYGIGSLKPLQDDGSVPENTTRIDDLDIIKKTPEVVSFLDESKKLRKCTVSMIDFRTDKEIEDGVAYKCFWDKNYIPENVQPIGCPIKYIANRVVKSYSSEISKEQYTITEPVTEKRSKQIISRNDKRLSINRMNYYETDGVFCSFNCCIAYINDPENKRSPMYRHSEALLLQMYNTFVDKNEPIHTTQEIMPAPHWRMLIEFGGTLSLEEFRDSFNKILYTDHGVISCRSMGRLYEDQIKF